MREKDGYRDVLEDILTYFDGKRMLTVTDVAAYTGLDRRTVVKRYEFKEHYISAMVLARRMI